MAPTVPIQSVGHSYMLHLQKRPSFKPISCAIPNIAHTVFLSQHPFKPHLFSGFTHSVQGTSCSPGAISLASHTPFPSKPSFNPHAIPSVRLALLQPSLFLVSTSVRASFVLSFTHRVQDRTFFRCNLLPCISASSSSIAAPFYFPFLTPVNIQYLLAAIHCSIFVFHS